MRHWLRAPPFGAQTVRGWASMPLRFVPIVPFPEGTLATMRNLVKGWGRKIRAGCIA